MSLSLFVTPIRQSEKKKLMNPHQINLNVKFQLNFFSLIFLHHNHYYRFSLFIAIIFIVNHSKRLVIKSECNLIKVEKKLDFFSYFFVPLQTQAERKNNNNKSRAQLEGGFY